jgi:proteasome accessory factor BC
MAESHASGRARRLLALLPFLREQRSVPLAELARSVGCAESEVAEDLSVLSLCGGDERDPSQLVGVIVEDGVAEVFADLPALERPVRLTPAEARALMTALQAIGADGNASLVSKLADFAARQVGRDEIDSTVRAAFAPGGQAEVLAALTVAAEQHVSVRIGYVSTSGSDAERVVRPHALYRWRDAWYLVGFCETAGEQRTFRVDSITSVVSTREPFPVPDGAPVEASPLPDLESMPRASVRFATDAPDLNDRDWPGATFERCADGAVIASVPYAGTAWIARSVASRLGDAEALDPPEVRRAVAESARAMLERAHLRTGE